MPLLHPLSSPALNFNQTNVGQSVCPLRIFIALSQFPFLVSLGCILDMFLRSFFFFFAYRIFFWLIETIYCQRAKGLSEARILRQHTLHPQLLLYKSNFYSHQPFAQATSPYSHLLPIPLYTAAWFPPVRGSSRPRPAVRLPWS